MSRTELLHIKDFPNQLHDEIADKVAMYTVGLTGIGLGKKGEDPMQSGSGTLVQIGSRSCIVTADHVIEDVMAKNRLGLLIDFSGGSRRCVFDIEHLRFLRTPRGSPAETGPDLGVIVLPASGDGISTLRSLKTFYNLERRIAEFGGVYPDVKEGFWFTCGVLGEGSATLPPERGFTKVTGHWGLCAVAANPEEFRDGGFDILDLRVPVDGVPDMPRTFGGMSGGGLWQAQIAKGKDGLRVARLTYSGVIFYQTAVVDGWRKLRSHGRMSVHERVPELLGDLSRS